jgi:hypothetical protein
MIVPDAYVEAARNLAACVDEAGHGMWTTPLSADGETTTHWISSGALRPEFVGLMADPAAAFAAAQAGAAAQGLTLTATLQDVEDLIAAADVSSEDPDAAIGRLELQRVVEDEA